MSQRISIHQPLKDFKCIRCNELKPVSEFPKYKKGRGFQGVCKECKRVWERKRRKENPLYYREQDLKQNYGIDLKTYNNMLNKQCGVCAICGKKESMLNRSLAVDHCHVTNKVRGLLCGHCNHGLGKFFDQIAYLEKAIEYLRNGGSI